MKIKFGNTSLKKLTYRVDPRLIHIAMELQNEDVDCDCTIFETTRTKEKQIENVKKGVSKTLDSRHIPNNLSIVNAIDIVPYVGGKATWSRALMDKSISPAIRRVVKRLGYQDVVTLGCDYKTFYDPYHIEITKNKTKDCSLK